MKDYNLPTQPLLRSKEVANLLSISEELLRKSRSTGYLLGRPAPTHCKLGRSVRYKMEDLECWIDSSRVERVA
jgi:predicted DNA-binding transcriptional regulator AlpA